MARQCSEGVPPTPSVVSAPEIQRQFGGVPSATAVSAGCVICGGSHQARRCALREGRCFRCGQSGHVKYDCPMGDGRLPPTATTFTSPGQLVDVQLVARSRELGVVEQPEDFQGAPSGPGYAAQVEEPATVGDVTASMI